MITVFENSFTDFQVLGTYLQIEKHYSNTLRYKIYEEKQSKLLQLWPILIMTTKTQMSLKLEI